jgi:uncharacterized membrane protein YeaQ/YmgE (transglycosylase-associated protein family)
MTLLGFVVLLVIAAVCGMLGQALSGYSVGGCVASTIVGFIGAFIGMWMARQLGLPELVPVVVDGETFPVVWSIVGSALLSLLLGLISRGSRRPRRRRGR